MLEAILFFCLGAILGSFVGALVWRLRHKKDWVRARSQCENCSHVLAVKDLIPVFSYLALGGRCRYCHKPIARSTFFIEITLGLVFAGSFYLWPLAFSGGQVVLFVSWLASAVGLLALALYDLKWMLLPNVLIYPTLVAAVLGRFGYILFYSSSQVHDLYFWLLSLAVASGFFLLIYIFSNGKLIGFGDVRLGLITGTLLATPLKSMAMIFLASLIGTIIALPGLISGSQKLSSRLPFGPFLISATAILVVFGDKLTHWYNSLFY